MNMHPKTVEGFGFEWTRFDQSALPEEDLCHIFDGYFRIFPWDKLSPDAVGFDLGCGSGRWAKRVAPRVGILHCIDASAEALSSARRNLSQQTNCIFHNASVDEMPIEDGSMDFGYSLGVLHHVPDTLAAIRACVAKLKAGAPFLIYLYYALDNRPFWFRGIWRITDAVRMVVSRLPYGTKSVISEAIAVCIYFPLARVSRVVEGLGIPVASFPLSAYRNRSFYTMRTDAFDRFATQMEKRFTAKQIQTMMTAAGLERISFNDRESYWCALGYRRT
ncbi:MAG: SAM-dependent methyltransferase [Acidobacteria bacterium]|nr:MAG: SAM-dependent methyltransferase [Acidobacteriota bacterium]